MYLHTRGICSITEKNQSTGEISLPFDTAGEMIQQVTAHIHKVLEELDDFTSVPIILCTIVGIDLISANKRADILKHPKQDIMDQAILAINENIVKKNTDRGYDTPPTASAVHRQHSAKKGYKHSYCRLVDGVHPNEAVLRFWAKRFEESFRQFFDNRNCKKH